MKSLLSLAIFLVLISLIDFGGAFAQSIPQPAIINYDPGIANFRPAFWGEMVEVRGNNFANGETYDNHTNVFAKAFLVETSDERESDFPLITHVASSNFIYFLIPVEAPCGEQKFYIVNGEDVPNPPRSPNRFIFIECAEAELGPQSVRPEITSIEPRLPRAGDELTLRGTGFTFSNEVKWDNSTLESVAWISKSEVRVRIPANADCGRAHSLRFQNIIQHYPSENSSFPSPSQPIFLTLDCAAPVAPIERSLSDIDVDGNCRIDDFEFFNAVDAWVVNEVSDELFFKVVDAWVEEGDACTLEAMRNSGGNLINRVTKSPNSVKYGADYAPFSVRILGDLRYTLYDSSGNEVLSFTGAHSKLVQLLRNVQSDHLANGVYFVRDHTYGKISKWVIIK